MSQEALGSNCQKNFFGSNKLSMVEHATYSVGRNREDRGSKPAWAKY
jgi:hypothetical protein